MKHFSFRTFLLLIFFSCGILKLHSQTNGFLYGIGNPGNGTFWFSKMDVNSGVYSQLVQLPMTSFSGAGSSCIDDDLKRYYFCTGKQMMTLDPITGTIISIDSLPMPSTADFVQIQFNPCDSLIYGIVFDSQSNTRFVKYMAATNTFYTISTLTITSYCMGCMSFIDPINLQYVYNSPTGITAIDLATGTIVYSTTIINLPNEIFGHIAYDCKEGRIIGTSGNTQQQFKYLAEVNPATGIVSHISTTGWQTGFWKPAVGGDCIDQSLGIYYYSGSPDLACAVTIATGDSLNFQHTGSDDFYMIRYFSQCQCTPAGISNASPNSAVYSVYPNPANGEFTLELKQRNSNEMYELELTNALGELISKTTINGSKSQISLKNEAAGIYFYRIFEGEKAIGSGKIVLE